MLEHKKRTFFDCNRDAFVVLHTDSLCIVFLPINMGQFVDTCANIYNIVGTHRILTTGFFRFLCTIIGNAINYFEKIFSMDFVNHFAADVYAKTNVEFCFFQIYNRKHIKLYV